MDKVSIMTFRAALNVTLKLKYMIVLIDIHDRCNYWGNWLVKHKKKIVNYIF